jgi:ABC-type multidrug transport system fused ATPase/permease subunit
MKLPALDPATDVLIECAVERLVQNRTAIITSLTAPSSVDEIMVLENGKS